MNEEMLIEALKAIAHPLRHRILRALFKAELNVGEIEEATGIGQPALSQQLGVLRKAELVDTRKEAKLVFYALAADALGAVAGAVGALVPERQGTPAEPAPSRTPAPGVANFARMS